jgi:hypothetical protein
MRVAISVQFAMIATGQWFLLSATICTVQLNCFAAGVKSYGDSEDFLWVRERQARSPLDAAGKMIVITETVTTFGAFAISTDERISFVMFIFLIVPTNSRN